MILPGFHPLLLIPLPGLLDDLAHHVVTFDLTLEVTVVPDPTLGAETCAAEKVILVFVPFSLRGIGKTWCI